MSERKIRRKKLKGEFSFDIVNLVTPNTKVEFSVYGYTKPEGSLYVNGVWISKTHMKKMAEAIFECLEFVK